MSNITKLPKDAVQLAHLRILLSDEKSKARILAKQQRVLKAENRDLKTLNANLNHEIEKLNEKASLLPTLQEEIKRLIADLEKCRKAKHIGNQLPGGPQSWMAR